MVEDTIEVILDDFSVVSDSFDRYSENMAELLKMYENCNFVLN